MFHLSPARPHRHPARGFWSFWAALLAACALLVACGGGGGGEVSSSPDPSGAVTQIVGAEGGTVTGPDGVQVVIPAGALEANTAIGIARSSTGAPPTLEGYPPLGPVYAFTPHGIHFNMPITIRLPIASADHKLFMASQNEDWSDTAFVYSGGVAEFQRNGFSWGYSARTACSDNPSMAGCTSPNGTPPANSGNSGSTWQLPTPVATDSINQVEPRVAMDASGQGVAVWMQQKSGETFRLWAQRYTPGSGWGTAVQIDTGSGLVRTPQVAMDGSGNALVVWHQIDGSTFGDYLIYSNYYRTGVGWGTATLAEGNDHGPTFDPRIGFDAYGYATAVWNRTEGGRIIVASKRFHANLGWGSTTAIGDTLGGGNMAVSGNGDVYAVWLAEDGTAWGNHYSPSIGWGTATQISNGNVGDTPQIAVEGNGNAMAVWTQATANSGSDTVHANRTHLGRWGTAMPIETDYAAAALNPHIAMQANGDAMVAWTKELDNGVQTLWARAFVAGIWGTAQLLESATSNSSEPQLALDGQGNAMLLLATGPHQNIRAQHYRAAAGWQSATWLTNLPTPSYQVRLAMDPLGNAMAAWTLDSGNDSAVFLDLFRAQAP